MQQGQSSELHRFDVEIISSLVLFCTCIMGLRSYDSTVLVDFGRSNQIKDETISDWLFIWADITLQPSLCMSELWQVVTTTSASLLFYKNLLVMGHSYASNHMKKWKQRGSVWNWKGNYIQLYIYYSQNEAPSGLIKCGSEEKGT